MDLSLWNRCMVQNDPQRLEATELGKTSSNEQKALPSALFG
jgi:hypothetical protein